MALFSFSVTLVQSNEPYKNPDMLLTGWIFLSRGGKNQQPRDQSESRPGTQGGRHLICVASWEDGTAVAEDTLTLPNLVLLQRLVEAQNPQNHPVPAHVMWKLLGLSLSWPFS